MVCELTLRYGHKVSVRRASVKLTRPADTLARILRATGATLVVDAWTDAELDAAVNGDILLQVLDLSEHLPSRRPGELDAPIFAKLAR